MRTGKKALIVFLTIIVILVFLAITSSISFSNNTLDLNFIFSYHDFIGLNALISYMILIFAVFMISGFAFSIKGDRY